jgi:tetratricopeptide (TPR) repeat protein
VKAILNRLEFDAVELREQVLAEALLQQMDETMGEMLSQGLVFELPVPREALTAVCENIPNLENYINRAVALGLLEVSPDQSLRVPRILPLKLSDLTPLTPLPWEGMGESNSPLLAGEGLGERSEKSLYQQGAEVLYRLWWEEAETSTEEEKLEIHRLALLGKQGEIASKVGSVLASNWKNTSRFREALHLCKSTLNTVEDYRIFHQLARSEQELGEIEQAQQHYQQALKLCPAREETEKASIIHNLAGIYANTGKIEEAIALYQQSLEIKESIGDVQGKAATLHCLAIIYADTGKIEEAIAHYQQSLEIEESIGNVQGKAATLHCLAIIYANTGKIEEAIAHYQQSLEITESIGDVKTKAATLHQLAIIYANTGKIDDAIALYQQSLEITESIGDVKTKAATLHQLASIYADTGKIDDAIAHYQQSLEINESIGNVQGKAATLHQLAGIYADTGKIEEAIAHYQQSLEINESIGNVQGQAATLAMLGQLLASKKGDFVTALDYLHQSLEIFQRIQSPNAETVIGFINNVQKMANG